MSTPSAPEPKTIGVNWFAASLDQILDLARASDLDAHLAGDLAEARDLALMIEDWSRHRAGCGDYFFTVSLQIRKEVPGQEDQVSSLTFSLPHDPDAAEFIGRLTRQIGLLAGLQAQDLEVMGALTDLTGIAAGLYKALMDSLGEPNEQD
ncbi:MAG TPA: hypothetical protein VGH27_07730 [Streptosporangiaceae bacterium]|jgi:hypothetical protein